EAFEARDSRATFTVFVPPGAPAEGARLAAARNCKSCHGAELRGALAPPLAGRSPSYLARQLTDMRAGTRHDAGAAPMRPIAATLNNHQILSLTAYLASLPP
ncbi:MULTISPECIES: c-type cytochrome, partial [Streptomyces]